MKKLLAVFAMTLSLIAFQAHENEARAQLGTLTASKTSLTNTDTASLATTALPVHDGFSMQATFTKATGTANGCRVYYQWSNNNNAWVTISSDTIVNNTLPQTFGYKQETGVTSTRYYRILITTNNTITGTITDNVFNRASRPVRPN